MLPIDYFIEESALLKAGIYEIPETVLPEIETGNKSYDQYGMPLFSSIELGKSEIDTKTFDQAQGQHAVFGESAVFGKMTNSDQAVEDLTRNKEFLENLLKMDDLRSHMRYLMDLTFFFKAF